MNIEVNIMSGQVITKEKAVEIAEVHFRKDKKNIKVYDSLPSGSNVYGVPEEKCWYFIHQKSLDIDILMTLQKNFAETEMVLLDELIKAFGFLDG